MKDNTKKVLMGFGFAACAVAAVSSVSYYITKHLVEVALDREEPKAIGNSKERLTGNKNIEEIIKAQNDIAKRLESLDLKTVEITAQDSTKLVGHLFTCKNAKRTIIAMHGWRSSWSKDFGMLSDFLLNNNCNVLFAEQRGQGESGGEYMGFGLTERFDCLDWINWVNSQEFKSLPIYLLGISMGATTVLMAAGFNLQSNVCGIIADCGFTSPSEIWKHVAQNMNLLYTNIRGNLASALCKKKINVGSDDYSTITALQNSKVPVLLIHGTDDRFVPVQMTYENYKACISPKKLLIVPGAEHGMCYVKEQDLYEKTVKEFWQENDNKI